MGYPHINVDTKRKEKKKQKKKRKVVIVIIVLYILVNTITCPTNRVHHIPTLIRLVEILKIVITVNTNDRTK